ncbi:ABC transporter substrate-binding protein [Nakamurella leprariae]|uniref:Solute-binding protein family 5 domain-containing protein n=1 Tax=Nakamurella leprariae TaxID=2803911 RepID=A0A938YDB1_9ACTN|nr:ABC transporter substrate-binding protein [Nakamurella leprariae]MBM9467481.1 hypothetical protein [Nakamurella leprariae]
MAASALWAQGLTYLDADFVPQPRLAESWESSSDGLTHTYHLRPDVVWHDGEPFTAEDVVWTLTDGVANLANAKLALANATSITALDDHTVEIVLSEPSSVLPTVLSEAVVRILPAHVYRGTDITTSEANLAPIGTGPFKFDSWAKGESISYVRNEDYWDGAPALDGVTIALFSDTTAVVNALRTGEIDYTPWFPDTAMTLVAGDDEVVVGPSAGVFPTQAMLAFNTVDGPTADPGVRRALVQAIDRDQILQSAWSGAGQIGEGPIAPSFVGRYDPDITYTSSYPYDVEAAKAALDAAGYAQSGNSPRFSIVYKTFAGNEQSLSVGELLRSQLAEVGVEVSIEAVDNASIPTVVFTDFDFDLFHTTYFDADPAFILNRQYSCGSVGVQYGNMSQYCSPELDAALADLLAATTTEEYDSAITDATSVIMEDVPYLVMVNPQLQRAWRSNLHGVEELSSTSANWPNFGTVSFTES